MIHPRRIPLALLLFGVYAETPTLTADLHATVHRQAAKVYGNEQRKPIDIR